MVALKVSPIKGGAVYREHIIRNDGTVCLADMMYIAIHLIKGRKAMVEWICI